MRQELARTVTVAASRTAVWQALLDVQRVASWIRIVGQVQELEPLRRYSAVLEDRMGPFTLRADLAVTVIADDPRLHVEASGEDRQIASRISAAIDLAVAEDGAGTAVAVTGAYEISGRIATLGAGAIRKKGEHVLEEFFANMTRDLSAS